MLGNPGIQRLTVLYDSACPLCRAAARWLGARAQLVPLELLPAASIAARRRFPTLDHRASQRDVTVVADTGAVYRGDAAWLACLWALDSYRDLAYRLASPELLPVARKVVAAAAAVRQRWREEGYGGVDDEGTCAEGQCG